MMRPSRGATEAPGVQPDPTTPQQSTIAVESAPVAHPSPGDTTALADASVVETIRDSTGAAEE